MDVKKCDRCGEIIECKSIEDKSNMLFVYETSIVYDITKALKTKADLCDECTKKLNEWLKGM